MPKSLTSSKVTAIGFFILTGTVLLVAMLIAFGGGSWLRDNAVYTMHFNSSVQGLAAGSPVMFRGVKIGQVTAIRLQSPEEPVTGIPQLSDADQSAIHFPVVVTVEIDPQTLGFAKLSWWEVATGKSIGHNRKEELEAYLSDMVLEQGLRAKLQTLSLLTGQLSVELSFDSTANEQDNPEDLRSMLRNDVFPTRLGFLDQVSNRIGERKFRSQMESIQKLIAQISDFIDSGKSRQFMEDVTVVAANLRNTTSTLNQKLPPLLESSQNTIAGAQTLLGTANAQLDPIAGQATQLMGRLSRLSESARVLLNTLNTLTTNAQPQLETLLQKANASLDEAQLTLQDTRGALHEARAAIAPDSPTRQNLEQTLDDCQNTLNTIRTLLENLNRNPQILLLGE